MSHYKGVLKEVLLEPYQNAAGILSLPQEGLPRPGQYLQVHSSDPMEVIARSLFPACIPTIEKGQALLPVSGPLVDDWGPGTELFIRGPLGNGFILPKRAKRVALISLEANPGKLIPLAHSALNQRAEVSLFAETAPTYLPLGIEVQSIADAPRVQAWADYIALSVPFELLDAISAIFANGIPKRLAVEVLVVAPMPCGGLARCGVCSFEAVRGTRFPCEDGPIIPLTQIHLGG